MPALLREVLILELDRRNPGLLIALDGVADVDEATETGVGIGDERRLGAASDRARSIEHLRKGGEAGVGEAEV